MHSFHCKVPKPFLFTSCDSGDFIYNNETPYFLWMCLLYFGWHCWHNLWLTSLTNYLSRIFDVHTDNFYNSWASLQKRMKSHLKYRMTSFVYTFTSILDQFDMCFHRRSSICFYEEMDPNLAIIPVYSVWVESKSNVFINTRHIQICGQPITIHSGKCEPH